MSISASNAGGNAWQLLNEVGETLHYFNGETENDDEIFNFLFIDRDSPDADERATHIIQLAISQADY